MKKAISMATVKAALKQCGTEVTKRRLMEILTWKLGEESAKFNIDGAAEQGMKMVDKGRKPQFKARSVQHQFPATAPRGSYWNSHDQAAMSAR